jgi:hypothetical protein
MNRKVTAVIAISVLCSCSSQLDSNLKQSAATDAPLETIVGRIAVGQLDSAIEVSDQRDIVFLTNSEVGTVIFKTCGFDDWCQIIGQIERSNDLEILILVKSVKLLPKHDNAPN